MGLSTPDELNAHRGIHPLAIVGSPTPALRLNCSHWHLSVGGHYPKVYDRGVPLSAVNRALASEARRAQRFLVGHRCPTVDVPPGFFRPSLRSTTISASTVVVSALMPTASIPPGANFSYDWTAVTIDVATARSVSIGQLFERVRGALNAIGLTARRLIIRRSTCIRQFPNDSGFDPTPANFRYFALLPSGLAIGFTAGAVGPRVCGWLSVTVPYRILHPYLSDLGRRLIAGARRPASFRD
jgi:hypothetical protein